MNKPFILAIITIAAATLIVVVASAQPDKTTGAHTATSRAYPIEDYGLAFTVDTSVHVTNQREQGSASEGTCTIDLTVSDDATAPAARAHLCGMDQDWRRYETATSIFPSGAQSPEELCTSLLQSHTMRCSPFSNDRLSVIPLWLARLRGAMSLYSSGIIFSPWKRVAVL